MHEHPRDGPRAHPGRTLRHTAHAGGECIPPNGPWPAVKPSSVVVDATTEGRARVSGYVPLRDYAAIGDGRTAALIAGDGSLDWLACPISTRRACSPPCSTPSEAGASCSLPSALHAERRYLPDTNVLETTFRTEQGAVRVTDAMLLPSVGLAPARELARRIEGVAGARADALARRAAVRIREPARADRPARWDPRWRRPDGTRWRVCAWAAGDPSSTRIRSAATSTTRGRRGALVLSVAHQEPLVLPSRADVESRLAATIAFWRDWAADRAYDGPWRDAVIRSALVLKLLIHAPSGAIAAAATASLPEEIGGERNWDYRFCWIRDSAFTLEALLQLGCPREGESFFWWLLHASQLTHPRLRVLYRLDGGERTPESELALSGYRGSSPVRVGNAAAARSSSTSTAICMQTRWLYAGAGGAPRSRHRPAPGRDRRPRLRDLARARQRHLGGAQRATPLHPLQDHVLGRARPGDPPGRARPDPARHAGRWRAEADAIRAFVESAAGRRSARSYVRSAGSPRARRQPPAGGLDGLPRRPRSADDRDDLGAAAGAGPRPAPGSLQRRGRTAGGEGAFLCCSFWLVDALRAPGASTTPPS